MFLSRVLFSDGATMSPEGHGALWNVLNSQAVLTLITVGIGGLFAAWLTAKWQRNSELFKTRIDSIKTVLEQHKSLGDALEKGKLHVDKESVYQVELSLAFLRALFPGKTERQAIKDYHTKFAAVLAEQVSETRVALGREAGTELGNLLSTLVKRLGIKG
jgi:hypothetical protein